MLADKEVAPVSHGVEGPRVDGRLKRFRESEEELVTENTLAEVEYQPKGYLRVLKKTLEREIRSHQ
jgi:hypothetical protein